MKKILLATLITMTATSAIAANSTVIEVTRDNYVVAETDWYFNNIQQDTAINTFKHNPIVTLEQQDVIRSNSDVVYSVALVDVSEGATFTVPAGDNYQVIHYMDENHLTHGVVEAGNSVTISSADLTGGDHVYILARTRVTENHQQTVANQHALTIEANSATPYQGKGFAPKDVQKMRSTLVQEYMAGVEGVIPHLGFGATMDDVDATSYLYAAAVGWGGLPAEYAQYAPFINNQGSAEACQTLTFDKPNLRYDDGGFFSLTTYNAAGWIATDNFYLGHEEMQVNADDTMTIYFNCPEKEHSLDVLEGWTGVFRIYQPSDTMESVQYIQKVLGTPVQSNN